MAERSRASRFAVFMSPEVLRHFPIEASAWHESEEEVAAGIAWGREKAVLIKWVRVQMGERLTKRERECLELYFFRNMTYRQVGLATSTNGSSAYRAVMRALRKLREAAVEDGPKNVDTSSGL
jgi:DNA-directed RNA polymerase specialized sigma24 family protein